MKRRVSIGLIPLLLALVLVSPQCQAYWHINLARLKQIGVIMSPDFGVADVQMAHKLAPDLPAVSRAVEESMLANGDSQAFERISTTEKYSLLQRASQPRWMNLVSALSIVRNAGRDGDLSAARDWTMWLRDFGLRDIVSPVKEDQHRAILALPMLVHDKVWSVEQAQGVVALWTWLRVAPNDVKHVVLDEIDLAGSDPGWQWLSLGLDEHALGVVSNLDPAWRYFAWLGRDGRSALFVGGAGQSSPTAMRIDCVRWRESDHDKPYAEFARRYEMKAPKAYRLMFRYRTHRVVGGMPLVALVSPDNGVLQLVVHDALPATQGGWSAYSRDLPVQREDLSVELILRNSGLGSVEFDDIMLVPIAG